jgi:hypothetical protein
VVLRSICNILQVGLVSPDGVSTLLLWWGLCDFKSYAIGSIAIQVMGKVLDKERHPHPPGWGLGIGLT